MQTGPGKELLPALPIQFSLTVGAVDDPLEEEADTMADTVMRMPMNETIQRKCSHCEEEKEEVQRKPLSSSITPFIQTKSNGEGTTSNALTNQINNSRGNGSNMDGETRSFMENRFGGDFSNVKIHTGNESVMMNRELSAKAFTVGNDIYFNEGQYDPQTNSGKHLLAHELTHTIQQGASRVSESVQRDPLPFIPEVIAAQLRDASVIVGTNEAAIFNALTGKTPEQIAAISMAFVRLSGGQTLEAMLNDELSGDDLSRALSLLRGETPATETARVLWNAMRGLGTDESAIYATVAGRTAAQWTDIQNAYRQMTGNNLLTDLRDELWDSEWNYLQTLLPGAAGGAATDEDRATVIANRLEAAMDGPGTDEPAIYAALTGHSDAELREIERKYRLITGRELNADLLSELTAGEYEQAQLLLHSSTGYPERLAISLRDAMDGPGTDEDAIYAALTGRSPELLAAIRRAYLALTQRNLDDDLRDDLNDEELRQANLLMNGSTVAQLVPYIRDGNTRIGAEAINNSDEFRVLMDPASEWQTMHHVTEDEARLVTLMILNRIREGHTFSWASDGLNLLQSARQRLEHTADRQLHPASRLGIEISVISEAESVRLFNMMRDLSFFNSAGVDTPIPYHYPADGCYARAHLMAQRLTALGYASQKEFAVSRGAGGGLTVSSGHSSDTLAPGMPATTTWWYHVAPVITVQLPDGRVVQRILDPSLASSPISVDQWTGLMRSDTFRQMSLPDLRDYLAANPGFNDVGNITFTTDRDSFYPADLRSAPNQAAGNSQFQGTVPTLTTYAQRVPAHELAQHIRTELAKPAVDVPAIIAHINRLPADVRIYFAGEFRNLMRDVNSRVTVSQAMDIITALSAP